MRFFVPGQPYGKARPRSGKYGVYNPKTNAISEQKIRDAYIQARGMVNDPITQPVWLNVELVFAIPKATPKKKREMMLARKIRPQIKPDIDNCLKTVMDALNKVAYLDDKQVVLTRCMKRYGETPGTIIDIGRYYE